MKAMFVVDVVSTSPNSILIIEDDEVCLFKRKIYNFFINQFI